MLKYLALLAILVAVITADNVLDVAGNFEAETMSLTWQTVRFSNLLEGEGLENAIHDVKFSVTGSSVLLLSALLSAPVSVGTIVASSSGYGQFSVIATTSGRFTISVNVEYKTSEDVVVNFSQEFVMVIDDDLWLLKRGNGISMGLAPTVGEKDKAKRSDVASRQPGNSDANITPTQYYGIDSVQTWNSFYIHAGGPNLLNSTFSVIVTDSGGVGVTYPYDIGNAPGSIPANTTYYTSIAFTGGPGAYLLNCSVRYRRQLTGSWKLFWMPYPLYIEETDSTSLRAAEVVKKQQVATQNTLVVDTKTVVGVSVGAVALVAAVAIVAVVVIKKKQTPVSV